MRRASAGLVLLALAGCAGPPPRPVYRHAWPAHHRTWIVHHHASTRHHRTDRRHTARRIPPGSFLVETKRRCRDGDDGACRMLRAMGED